MGSCINGQPLDLLANQVGRAPRFLSAGLARCPFNARGLALTERNQESNREVEAINESEIEMNAPQNTERRNLLRLSLENWKTTGVDVRSLSFSPSQRTGVHSHPCPVVGYIVEGAAILQVEGQPEQRLDTGAAFYEPAGARIVRFDNASAERPLHFIAVYLLKGEHPLIEMLG